VYPYNKDVKDIRLTLARSARDLMTRGIPLCSRFVYGSSPRVRLIYGKCSEA